MGLFRERQVVGGAGRNLVVDGWRGEVAWDGRVAEKRVGQAGCAVCGWEVGTAVEVGEQVLALVERRRVGLGGKKLAGAVGVRCECGGRVGTFRELRAIGKLKGGFWGEEVFVFENVRGADVQSRRDGQVFCKQCHRKIGSVVHGGEFEGMIQLREIAIGKSLRAWRRKNEELCVADG